MTEATPRKMQQGIITFGLPIVVAAALIPRLVPESLAKPIVNVVFLLLPLGMIVLGLFVRPRPGRPMRAALPPFIAYQAASFVAQLLFLRGGGFPTAADAVWLVGNAFLIAALFRGSTAQYALRAPRPIAAGHIGSSEPVFFVLLLTAVFSIGVWFQIGETRITWSWAAAFGYFLTSALILVAALHLATLVRIGDLGMQWLLIAYASLFACFGDLIYSTAYVAGSNSAQSSESLYLMASGLFVLGLLMARISERHHHAGESVGQEASDVEFRPAFSRGLKNATPVLAGMIAAMTTEVVLGHWLGMTVAQWAHVPESAHYLLIIGFGIVIATILHFVLRPLGRRLELRVLYEEEYERRAGLHSPSDTDREFLRQLRSTLPDEDADEIELVVMSRARRNLQRNLDARRKALDQLARLQDQVQMLRRQLTDARPNP